MNKAAMVKELVISIHAPREGGDFTPFVFN